MEVRPALAEGAERETAHSIAGKVRSHQGNNAAIDCGEPLTSDPRVNRLRRRPVRSRHSLLAPLHRDSHHSFLIVASTLEAVIRSLVPVRDDDRDDCNVSRAAQ